MATPNGATGGDVLAFASKDAWESWLANDHATSEGIWLKIAKKSSAVDSVTYAEALEVGLCYGWIDGQKQPFDERHWLQRFTPRRARSRWSKINRDAAENLIAAGKMQSAGMREVERAKADGRWAAAYASQKTATVPDDLQRALGKNAKARKFFETLDSRNRYAILYRIQDAKRPETRARRIAQFVEMLKAGQRIWKPFA